MKLRVKICGITNIEDAAAAIKLGADSLGFIFYEKSKRYIAPREASALIKEIRNINYNYTKNFLSVKTNIPITGVFVNEDLKLLDKIISETGIDIIQLSGNETVDYIKALGYEKKILKAVRIKNEKDINKVYLYEDLGVNILLDTFITDNIYGGTGISFDRSIIKNIDMSDKLIAGGIGTANIKYIRDIVKPYGVDLSSKVERFAGKKDHDKMYKFFSELNMN
jgi:phosphoribosylanthranilate isomerase